MFGLEPRIELATSAFPSDLLENIEDEDELQRVIEINVRQNEAEILAEEEHVNSTRISQERSSQKYV